MEGERKIIIVNWKWKIFQDRHINADALSKEEFHEFSVDIDKGKGIFFDEYAVEPSYLCPNALLVATSIYNEGPQTKSLLYALIDKYAKDGNQVMIFLHRSNFFEDPDLQELMDRYKNRIAKCFLFAFGRDYIYYSTQRSGFLNDTGGFFRGRDPISKEKVLTFDPIEQQVMQPFFDRVWQYYQTEFEIKILNLKESVFDCFLPLLLPDSPMQISRHQLFEALRDKESEGLLLRIKSFLGKYDLLDQIKDFEKKYALEEELRVISKLEKEHRESYVFDDCILNLEHEEQNGKHLVKEVYDQTKEQLDRLLFKTAKKNFKKQDLHQLSASMEELIKVVPGEID